MAKLAKASPKLSRMNALKVWHMQSLKRRSGSQRTTEAREVGQIYELNLVGVTGSSGLDCEN